MLQKDFQDQENLIEEIKKLAFDLNRWQEYEMSFQPSNSAKAEM